MSGWQPQQYDPRQHQQRIGGQQPQYPSQGYAGQPQQMYPPNNYPPPPSAYPYVQPAPAAPPRKKRRVFLWIFLAIQVLFIIWIIAGAASKVPGPSAASQAAQQCANGGWQGLFKSQADCRQHYAVALNDATNAGKGIGIALIVVFWVVVDFFLGLGYLIYKLAGR